MSTVDNEMKMGARSPLELDRKRLDSWKEIALYLDRDVRTAQRWEKREGLPVHRHFHEKASSVYAFKQEVDAWLKSRCPALSEPVPKQRHSEHLADWLIPTLLVARGMRARSLLWLGIAAPESYRLGNDLSVAQVDGRVGARETLILISRKPTVAL